MIRFRGIGQSIRDFLASHNGHIAYTFDGAFEAYLDPVSLPDLSALVDVDRVDALRRPEPQVISQGVQVHNAVTWQAAGFLGQGVKVGIIDVGFQGWSMLPLSDTPSIGGARCYTGGGYYNSNFADCQTFSDHGTAVAEATHDMAPSATYYLANPQTFGDMLNAVQWMVQQGVRVINLSVASDWDGPGDGTSPYPDSPLKAVDAAVAGGAVVSISSGNYGASAWFGPWQDPNADGYLEFDSYNNLSCLIAAASARVSVELRWQDAWGGASRDLDLELYDWSTGLMVSYSYSFQAGGPADVPHESLSYIAPVSGVYCVAVKRYAGTTPAWVQFRVASQQAVDVGTAATSVTNPAETANPGALAVGATNWQTSTTIETFSGRGPTPDGRIKPEVVGVDRADSYTYGPNGFPGTSQSSPHVAGLAALLVQGYPGDSPSAIATKLKNWALPRGAQPNNVWGYGLAYLPSVYNLTVLKAGSGTGTVTSADSMVNCGPNCVRTYFSDAQVTLTAVAAVDSQFMGWAGGGCAGTGSCQLTMVSAAQVTAYFAMTSPAPSFTDNPLVAFTTRVKAVHITELRSAVNILRSRYGLSATAWTDENLTQGVTTVKAAHLTELRAALAAAYSAAGMTPPSYSQPAIVARNTAITVADINELRAAIIALW